MVAPSRLLKFFMPFLPIFLIFSSLDVFAQVAEQTKKLAPEPAKVKSKLTPKKAAKKKAPTVAPPTSSNPVLTANLNKKTIRLSQKDIAELALKQGLATKEVNLQYLQNRLAPALVLSTYDWQFNLASGYQYDKSTSFSPAIVTGSKFERYRTDITLGKPLTTGTLLAAEIHRLSQKSDIPVVAGVTTTYLGQQTQDIFGLTIEQSLLGNSFGVADRATVNAAEITYQANEILRADQLETVALTATHLFWDTYVAQENFREALASRERNQKLMDSAKRKTSLGYSTPGELVQAQAEYESREQAVKSASVLYLQKLENLITSLNLEPGIDIEFVVADTLPPIPQLPPIKTDELRTIRSQKLKAEAANDLLTASRFKSYPTLNFVGKIYTTGTDETADGSYSNAVSGKYPQYYAGLRVQYNFGSDVQTEDIINKKATKELEEARLYRQLLEINDLLSQADRNVQSTYAIAQSTRRERDFLEKAVQELTRTYNQGRTDIKTLIDVMNSYFTSQVQLSRAVGNYQIALNELAAARDELVSEAKSDSKEYK